MVAAAAIAVGREPVDATRLAALTLTSCGLVLVLAGAGTGALDPLGAGLALTAAVIYATYVVVGEGLMRRVDPQVLAALVCTGAAVSLAAGSSAFGDLQPGRLTAAGWGWLAALALVSTVLALGLFLAGLRRVGPTTASILATVEPLMTVLLAFLVFGEALGAVQLAGAALVLAAVLALNAPRRGPALRPARTPA
jgi:drug/metabolite transporter (DMT)-like permease